jgi:acetyltransferase-like isoleucine patch superfamily enzyme
MSFKIKSILENKIGVRTFYKTYILYSKGKKYSSNKHLTDFLASGNSKIYLERTSKIVNKGKFSMGLSSTPDVIPTMHPCVLQMLDRSTLVINGAFSLANGAVISIFKGATLEVGANVMVSFSSKILCFENIKIGDDCMISWDVQIMDSDLHSLSREGFVMSKPIQIGNHVCIGARAMILKGTKISDGAIIAAGSVVARDVPQNCLVGGVPARILRQNISWT